MQLCTSRAPVAQLVCRWGFCIHIRAPRRWQGLEGKQSSEGVGRACLSPRPLVSPLVPITTAAELDKQSSTPPLLCASILAPGKVFYTLGQARVGFSNRHCLESFHPFQSLKITSSPRAQGSRPSLSSLHLPPLLSLPLLTWSSSSSQQGQFLREASCAPPDH